MTIRALQVLAILLALAFFAVSPRHAAADHHGAPAGEKLVEHPRVKEAIHLLDVWLEAQWAYEQLPGVSAGVVHDQTLVWSRGFGLANVETETPATPETIYSICSISKLFTAIGVMQLREDGKLNLDDPVSKHIPWFKLQNMSQDGETITVRSLLSHSAGVPRETDHPYWSAPGFPFPTRQEVIDTISQQTVLYPANKYYQYSNLGSLSRVS